MGNCVGSKGAKKDPKVLTEEEIKLLLDNTTLNRQQIVALHQNFLKECPTGKLTKKDFVKLFKEVHPSENKKEKADKFCEYVFKVIDNNNLGYISFQDFVLCFSLTSYGDFKQKCEFAFKLYDLDKDGKISKKEMTQVLTALYDLSGITDRKGSNAPAKKVEEIIKKINATYHPPADAAANPADAAVTSTAPTTSTAATSETPAPAESKDKKDKKEKEKKDKGKDKEKVDKAKEEKEKEKAEKKAKEKAEKEAKKEAAKKEKEEKAQKAKEAKEKKEKEKPVKAPKEPKAPKAAKPAKAPKAPKLPEFITKDQFIDACNSDETLKKLFVDSIFSNQNSDQPQTLGAESIENKIDDLANKINTELPTINIESQACQAPQVHVITADPPIRFSDSNGPVSSNNKSEPESPPLFTSTTKVITINNDEAPVSVTTTTTTNRLPTDHDERNNVAETTNSDSDQTHYSEHITEYVNVSSGEPKHYNVELSLDGLKVQSDKQQQ